MGVLLLLLWHFAIEMSFSAVLYCIVEALFCCYIFRNSYQNNRLIYDAIGQSINVVNLYWYKFLSWINFHTAIERKRKSDKAKL